MKIVKEKSSGLVKYLFKDTEFVNLSEKCLITNSFKALDIKSSTHLLIENVVAPPLWVSGALSYDTSWAITDQAVYDVAMLKAFEEAKKKKQLEINELFNVEVDTIKGDIVQGEVDTFVIQEKEALAYQADSTAIVPLLSGLANVRGLTVSELAIRVLDHAEVYKSAVALVMGKKHLFEDQLKSALTLDDVAAIMVV